MSAAPDEESKPHKEILYGEDYCRHACIVTEGPLDVWAIGPGAVATLGTSYTRPQLAALAKYPTRIICFDVEKAAQARAAQLMSELVSFPGETINVVLDTGKDPADADKEEIAEIRNLIS